MKIIHVIGTLNIGGAETTLLNLLKSSEGLEADFVVVCYTQKTFDLERLFCELPVAMTRLPQAKSIVHMYKLFRNLKPDVVHAHTDLNAGLVVLVAWLARVKVRVVHAHTSKYKRPRAGVLRQWYETVSATLIRNLSTLRLACSFPAGQALFGNRAFHVVINGIKSSDFRFDSEARLETRRRFLEGSHPNTLLIGAVARLEQVKNLGFALEVFAHFRSHFGGAIMVFAGEGSQRQNLMGKARVLGVSNSVRFVGTSVNVNELLSGIDVMVQPSFIEGLSVSVIEAQANGVPVVTSHAIPDEAIFNSNVVRLDIRGPNAISLWTATLFDVAEGELNRSTPGLGLALFEADLMAIRVYELYEESLAHSKACSIFEFLRLKQKARSLESE